MSWSIDCLFCQKSGILEKSVANWNDADWLRHMRMRKSTFYKIVREVSEDMTPDPDARRTPIPLDERVAIAIYKLSSAAEYRTVANLFGIGESTVYKFLKMFCDAICKRLNKYIYLPDEEEAKVIAQEIEQRYHFPQVYGCIDGTHIAVTAPVRGKRDYVNRKGWESIVLQAVVDNKYRIQLKFGDVQVPLMILGDPAYPLLPWLMKPYTGSGLSIEQSSYNCYLSSVRIIVENTFGRLKGRWRILGKKMDARVGFVPAITATCCVLHNLCEEDNCPIFDGPLLSESAPEQPMSRPIVWSTQGTESRVRQALTAHIKNKLPTRLSSRF